MEVAYFRPEVKELERGRCRYASDENILFLTMAKMRCDGVSCC
jgi:hypothetical protein